MQSRRRLETVRGHFCFLFCNLQSSICYLQSPLSAPRDWLGKIQRNPPIMAIRLFLDRDRAKAGDNPAAGLGKILRESPIMAISKGWPWS